MKEETGPKLLSLKQPCSLSVPTQDSGSKKRQAQNNSHFHSSVLSPGPTADSGTTKITVTEVCPHCLWSCTFSCFPGNYFTWKWSK